MAKDLLERYFRILVDDSGESPRDLSADLVPGSIRGGGLVYDRVEMTGVSNAVKHYLAGHAMSEIPAQFYMNDTATTGAFTVLKGIEGGAPGTLTMQWGTGAAPTTGDPEWEGEYVLVEMPISFNAGKAIINAVFVPGSDVAPAWGTVT